jgi:hypothetical protein
MNLKQTSPKRIPRPSAALIVAVIALVVAMGGTSLAAAHYVITSKHQIKPSVLKGLKGKRGRTGAIGPTGPQGATGATGAAGAAGKPGAMGKPGPKGDDGTSVSLATASSTQCPAGGAVVSQNGQSVPVCNGAQGTKTDWTTYTMSPEAVSSGSSQVLLAACPAGQEPVSWGSPSELTVTGARLILDDQTPVWQLDVTAPGPDNSAVFSEVCINA